MWGELGSVIKECGALSLKSTIMRLLLYADN